MKTKTSPALSRVAAVVAVTALGLVACGDSKDDGGGTSSAGAGGVQKVRFMMFPGQSYRLPVMVADKKGYFKENNIEIEVVEQPGQLQGMQGLAATKAHVGQVTSATLGQGVQSGEKGKFFCGGIDVLQTTLVAPNDSDLPSTEEGASPDEVLKSLAGKKVGIQTPVGSGMQKIFAEALKEAGVTDVTYVNLGGATTSVIAAVENGSVDVASANPTGTQFLTVNKKAKRLLYMPDTEIYQKNYGSAWVAPTSWLEENPEQATQVCATLGRALDYIKDPANKAEVSKILQEDTGIEAAVADLTVTEAYGDYSTELPKDTIDGTFKMYVDLGILKADPAPTYDLMVKDLTGGK